MSVLACMFYVRKVVIESGRGDSLVGLLFVLFLDRSVLMH